VVFDPKENKPLTDAAVRRLLAVEPDETPAEQQTATHR